MKHFYAFLILGLISIPSFATKHIVKVGWAPYTNNQFVPNEFNVTVGDTIRWEYDAGMHTTTSLTIPGGAATWDAPVDASNLVYEYKVTAAGVYEYECTIHSPAMHGTFTAYTTLPGPVTKHIIKVGWPPYSNNHFAPNLVDVLIGDTIRWEYAAGMHTSTSLTIPGGAATWDAPVDASNLVFEYKVTMVGTYDYECTIHSPAMHGIFNVFTSVGVNPIENRNLSNISLFPNPSNGEFQISGLPSGASLQMSSIGQLEIYNMIGEMVFQSPIEDLSNSSIDLSNQPDGVYFVSIKTSEGNLNRRIVVQK